MKLRKIIPMVVGTLAFCAFLPAMPQSGQAAEVTRIDTPKAGDTVLRVTFTDGQATDKFELYVNGKIVNEGTLGSGVTNPDSMYFNLSYIPEGGSGTAVKAGDKIEFRLQNGSELISHECVVAAEQAPNLPTSMKAQSSTVTKGDAVFASLIFDDAYVPDPDDKITVTRYDKNDKSLGSYSVDLPDVHDGPVNIQLNSSAATDHYLLSFVSGSGKTTSLAAVRIDVSAGGSETVTPTDPTDEQQQLINNAVSMTFSYPSKTVSLGESVSPTIQLTDASGKTSTYTGPAIFSYSGDAVADGTFDTSGRFTVGSEQKYIGTKIQVTAMVGSFSRTVELTVQAGDKSLILTPTSGSAGNARAVTFNLADESGNRLRLLWEPTVAKVVIRPKDSSSNAKMSGSVTNLSSLTTNGSGTMLISSDTAAEAELYIIFQDNSGRFYQTALTSFNFTESTGEGDLSMELFIGSSSYTVNGISHVADTQPVIRDNRTFVPYRLLAEALGGAVQYDETTKTITTISGGDTIVMTIGSTNYTINGTPATMDVAPYINSDSRTMVPLRFLGEALGCKVTAVYAAGTTTTVSVQVER